MADIEADQVYDLIFAGGGTAACITAGRLAAADPTLKILVVEAGPHTREVHDHVQPGRYFRNLGQLKDTFTFHQSKPSDALLGRTPIVPAGHAVGGGSSVNFCMYTRAAASDYDDWEMVHGNQGWGSSHLIPLLKKAETYQADSTNDTHGFKGPIKVSFSTELNNIGESFLEAAKATDKELSFSEDPNAFFSSNIYGRWGRYIDGESGRRSDTAHHYIYNQESNTNLKIVDRHSVVRVIFEGTRAIGIEYIDDTIGRSGGTTATKIARASRLVVLSAGAFGTPSILERSGIGAKAILETYGVKSIVDLPGVGENYMDHNVIFIPFVASDDAETMDQLFRGTEEEVIPHETQWLKDGKGSMSLNGLDCGMKMRPNAEELAAMSPEFSNRWETYFANAPDKPVMLGAPFAAYAGAHPDVPRGSYYSVVYFTGYPASVGRVHINSGSNPYAPLNFEAGYLNDPADVVVLRWAYKKFRELGRRMKFFRGEVGVGHPNFRPESTAAAAGLASSPADSSTAKVVYDEEDDKVIDEFHRRTVETSWHSVGTCAMKSREKNGVVDERLNVYGVQGLKVADCSITPSNVGANTYNTALAIGEKAAVIIAEDLGIKGVTAA